jgi:hypothetical protein
MVGKAYARGSRPDRLVQEAEENDQVNEEQDDGAEAQQW